MCRRHWSAITRQPENTENRVLEWVNSAQAVNRSWAGHMLVGIAALLALLWLASLFAV
jgi:hypothetical protein